MEKKYKINDGSSKHVETATLLEPANNSASNQNEAEELREVSTQLQQIKKKFDEARKLANRKQEELDLIGGKDRCCFYDIVVVTVSFAPLESFLAMGPSLSESPSSGSN